MGTSVVFKRIEMVLLPAFATARSGLLSPLKSPTATAVGLDPTLKVMAVWKVPSPFPSKISTLLVPFATARSSLLSPSKSLIAKLLISQPTKFRVYAEGSWYKPLSALWR